MTFAFRRPGFLVAALMLMACNDRNAEERDATTFDARRLVGTWDARFYLDRPLIVGSDSESTKQDVQGELAFLANRSVSQAYPMMESPSANGAFDVDFRPFGFDARSDDETPVAAAGWISADSLEIMLGNPNSDITVRMRGKVAADSIAGTWRVLVSRTGGGGGRFVMVRHR
jgi:hypothetical protein